MGGSMVKCSVVVPYANVGTRIINLLHSLENQSFRKQDFEVILVNNGEEDDIEQYVSCNEFSMNIKYYHYTKAGRSFARNFGIQKSVGELLIFVDGDEVVRDDFLKNHYDLYSKQEKPSIQFGLKKQLFWDNEESFHDNRELLKNGERKLLTEMERYGFKESKTAYYIEDVRHKMLKVYNDDFAKVKYKMVFVQTSNLSIPADCIQKYGDFDENFKGWGIEDWEMEYRMEINSVPVLYNSSIEVLHQYHNAIYDKHRYSEWELNLEYMKKKYHNDYINQIDIFKNFFNPEVRESIKAKDKNANVWMDCYKQIEGLAGSK